jgi:hypothetical protein
MPSIPTREESTRREYYDALSPGQTLKTYFWCNQSKKDWRHGSCGIECLSSKCEALSPYLNIKKKPYFFFYKELYLHKFTCLSTRTPSRMNTYVIVIIILILPGSTYHENLLSSKPHKLEWWEFQRVSL